MAWFAPDYSVGNQNGLEHYFCKTNTPAYAHSFLLTSIESNDYRDIDNIPGPSLGDLGTYTKFNYRDYSKYHKYQWRVPFIGANSNKGFYSNNQDDKASYVYGTKEIYYMHSIETQTHVAVFYCSNREDGFGAYGEKNLLSNGSVIDAALPLQRLDSICLYALKEYNTGLRNSIKTVVLDYSYELCYGIENSSNNGGKLTLKKVSFIYYNNRKGILSPYSFFYNNYAASSLNNNEGSIYKSTYIDKWGNYQPDNDIKKVYNAENPYVNQFEDIVNSAQRDYNVSVWNLDRIVLPSGGVIRVNYESDDYAFVQNVPAMQMMEILGFLTGDEQYDPVNGDIQPYLDSKHLRMCFRLEKSLTNSEKQKLLNYFPTNDTLYYKVFTKLKKDNDSQTAFDYVEGYSIIDKSDANWYGFVKDLPNSNTPNSIGYVDLKAVSIAGLNSEIAEANPIQKSGWQYLKMRRPDLLYPTQDFENTNIKQILNIFRSIATDIGNLLGGYEKNCYINGWCNKMVTSNSNSEYFHPSYVRLQTPDFKKYGGGHRVRKISIADSWEELSGESTSQYGQEFEYTCVNNGQIISSGVAEYEPLVGADEIPQHKQMIYPGSSTLLSKRDDLMIELPIGEQFFPAPKVGYSRVIVRNSNQCSNEISINKSGEGIRVYEYYTSRDFPVFVSSTAPDFKRTPFWEPTYIPYIGEYSSKGDGYSQGYKIELNDMPGKQKSVATYTHNANINDLFVSPRTKTEYVYYDDNYQDQYRKLKNNVDVLDSYGNLIPNAELGVTREFYIDNRESKSNTYKGGTTIDVDLIGSGPFIIPIPTVWPKLSILESMTRTIVSNKIISRCGILKEIKQTDNGSEVIVRNLMYDAVSGDALVTSKTNEFDAPIYHTSIPSDQYYPQMGAGYQNYRYKIKGSFTNGLFVPIDPLYRNSIKTGDKVLLLNPEGYACGYYWVTNDPDNNNILLLDKTGVFSLPSNCSSSNSYFLLNLETGLNNQQSLKRGDIASLSNPFLETKSALLEALTNKLKNYATSASSITINYLDPENDNLVTKTLSIVNGIISDISVQNDCRLFKITLSGIYGGTSDWSSLGNCELRKRGNQVIVKAPSGVEFICKYEDPDYCFKETLDGVIDANITTFINRIEYPASFIFSNQINDDLKNKQNTYKNENTKKYFVKRKGNEPVFDLSKDGTYDKFILYKYPASQDNVPVLGKWKKINRISKFNPAGSEIESQDILSHYSSAIYGYSNSLVTAIAKNAMNKECAFNGFDEYDDNTYFPLGNVAITGNGLSISHQIAHTGKASLKVENSSMKITNIGNVEFPPLFSDDVKDYLISFWTRTNDEITVAIVRNDNSGTPTPVQYTKSAKIEGWQKVEFKVNSYFMIQCYLIINFGNSGSSQISYVDDIRIHPLAANMITYVYNLDNQLLNAQLDENNYATLYVYDEYGKLVQNKRESEKGIYTIKTTRQNLSKINHEIQ